MKTTVAMLLASFALLSAAPSARADTPVSHSRKVALGHSKLKAASMRHDDGLLWLEVHGKHRTVLQLGLLRGTAVSVARDDERAVAGGTMGLVLVRF